ncbi:nose resistant to fluoxetine protein 6 [Scaptodrosophila lebanonensis]|uniref:Nose resistant to fluoxetine protein 6 n=1 Tax=Drosophila lebanonensis TaxID=7225 RepID=A0A6J2TNY3_DROLE|nr:nose resistant to fluoxetine protein 6 [Scaptodrosophila lebanonensis]
MHYLRWVLLGLVSAGIGAESFAEQNLLEWWHRSNFGYEVLTHALNGSSIISPSDDDSNCMWYLEQVLKGAVENKLEDLRVLDAWGKLPSGLLYGHLVDMGNYESCLLGNTNSDTKYCLASIHFDMPLPSAALNSLSLRIGTCIPALCSARLLNIWLNDYVNWLMEQRTTQITTLVDESNCAVARKAPMTGLDWFAVALLIFFGCLVLFSTILDYSNFPLPWLSAFALRPNLQQLQHIYRGSSNVVYCLNGIRCLTIIWIIFGHGFMFMLILPNINSYKIVGWAQTPFSMLLQSGSTAVDTFFMLSGMLLVLVSMRELDRNAGKLNVPLMYLHRLVRLTPVLAVAVLLFVTLFPRLDSGPLWQEMTSSYQLCKSTWWATLLYVQNYAAPGRMCLGHSWYLAVDMQLYILSPLLLLPLWHWRRKAVAGIVVIILLLSACVFSIVMLNGLVVFNRDGNLGADSVEMRKIYYTTHVRATPWLIGLLFGYFLHSERSRIRRRCSKWLVLCLWLLAMALLCVVIFGVFPYTQPNMAEMTPLAGAFYLCCSRIAWSLALCWIIWACQNGYGGIINSLLSWSLWQPLSKLSYCMYIWHLLVETAHAGRIQNTVHFSNYDGILNFWSHFGITLLFSLLMYLAVESPLVRLELQFLGTNLRENPKTTSISTPPTVSRQNLVAAA